MSLETADQTSLERVAYKPLTSSIPPEQSQKLDGAALFTMTENDEREEKEVKEVIPEKEPVKEIVEEVQEEVEEPQKVEKSDPIKIDSPLGDIEIPDKKAEKKPEVEEEDDDKAWEEVAGSQTKQKKAFIGLRQKEKELKQTKNQLAEYQRQVEELQSRKPEVRVDPEFQTRYEALEEKFKAQEQELTNFRKDAAVYRVEKSPDYLNKVQKPFEEEIQPVIIDLTKATNGQLNKNVFDTLARLDPVTYREEMRKLKETLEPGDYQELAITIPKYRQVIIQNKELRENADKIIALKQRELEQQQQGWEQEYKKELTGLLAKKDEALAKQLFSHIEDPEVKEMIEGARGQMGAKLEGFDWHKAPVEAQAAVMAGVKNYPIVVQIMGKQISALENKLAEAEKKCGELEKAQKQMVKAIPGAGVSSSGDKNKDSEPEVFEGKLDANKLFQMERSAQ